MYLLCVQYDYKNKNILNIHYFHKQLKKGTQLNYIYQNYYISQSISILLNIDELEKMKVIVITK